MPNKIYCCFCILQSQAVFWLNLYNFFDCLSLIAYIVIGFTFTDRSISVIQFAHSGTMDETFEDKIDILDQYKSYGTHLAIWSILSLLL